MELPLFDEVADVVHGLVPRKLGQVRCRAARYGIKVWLDAEAPPREHYEAQVMGAAAVPGAKVLVVEIGFHAEHPKEPDNQAVLDGLAAHERKWRAKLGPDAVAGAFLGRAAHWRRVSETWPDPDLSTPDAALELGARLVDYITALEPFR